MLQMSMAPRISQSFINIAKDDALAWPKSARRTYPAPTNARMESTIVPFVRKSLAVNATLIDVFNNRLGLPEGELAKRHTIEEFSGSEARCIKIQPKPQGVSEEQRAIGAHTDSDLWYVVCVILSYMLNAAGLVVVFLHNRLGGLQVLVPGTEKWQYVKVCS